MLTLVKDVSLQQTPPPPPQRKSKPQPRRGDYNRRRFLAWLRDEVVPALDAYRANPGEVYTADEVRALLAARRAERARTA